MSSKQDSNENFFFSFIVFQCMMNGNGNISYCFMFGCCRVLGYYSNVSEEFLTAGPRQRNEKVIQMGLYEMHENDTEMRFQSIKEEFLTSPAYEFYESVVYRIKLLRDRLWKHPETSPETKEEPKTAAKPVPKEASK